MPKALVIEYSHHPIQTPTSSALAHGRVQIFDTNMGQGSMLIVRQGSSRLIGTIYPSLNKCSAWAVRGRLHQNPRMNGCRIRNAIQHSSFRYQRTVSLLHNKPAPGPSTIYRCFGPTFIFSRRTLNGWERYYRRISGRSPADAERDRHEAFDNPKDRPCNPFEDHATLLELSTSRR